MSAPFVSIVRAHAARYPRMEPQDYVKLAYQSEFGSEHMAASSGDVLAGLWTELRQAPETGRLPPPEPIGGGLCRWALARDAAGSCERSLPLLARFFTATAAAHRGDPDAFQQKLRFLAGLGIPGMASYLEQYRAEGCPSVHHSDAYRAAYHPHYRVVSMDYVNYMVLFTALSPLVHSGQTALVAIDGRCGSGKTGLAALISGIFPCTVLHMDDFFLPFEKRTPERLATPGGNVDHERLLREVLDPLSRGEPALLRSFDCHEGVLRPPVEVPRRDLTILEGSYAHHPALRGRYDLTVFLTCSKEEQRRRLLDREGPGGLAPFLERWIPLEERYFSAFAVEDESDLVVDTTAFFTP